MMGTLPQVTGEKQAGDARLAEDGGELDVVRRQRRLSGRRSGLQSLSLLFLITIGLIGFVWLWPGPTGAPAVVPPVGSGEAVGEPKIQQLVKNQESSTATTSAATSTPTVLECFQVAQPVLTPHGASGQSIDSQGSAVTTEIPSTSAEPACSVLLMDHSFGWSYGMPFVGNYTPPSCAFNRVVMNFTVTSQGRQFDRLALMYLGDTEVWRTSTAEPTQPPGIRWTYVKDMTEYLSLWQAPQKLIFDLGNLIDDKYTGSFNTTLTATFFTSDVEVDTASPADLVIPISKRQGAASAVSQFTLPADNATNTIGFPRNANRAVFSVSACGQATEEFWWSNVFQSDTGTFNDTSGQLYGFSPFREVQVLIDGQLAGVQWPFPVIFTGGVVPSLHRPIVGLDAFDLREHEIDITPWLPLLCDGSEHTFAIQVAGLSDNGGSEASLTQTVGESWYVTGKVFVWLDDEGSVTTGSAPVVTLEAPAITLSQSVSQNATGTNETLIFNTEVKRVVSVRSTVTSQSGTGDIAWSQSLSYSNAASATDFGYTQTNDFSIKGVDTATGTNLYYRSAYEYPLWCNQTYGISPQGNLTIEARLIQGLDLQVEGKAVFPDGLAAFAAVPRTKAARYAGSRLTTTRDGTAAFFQTGDGKNSSGFGSTNQVFHFGGISAAGSLGDTPDTELYFRNVTAVNGTVVYNQERIAGQGEEGYAHPGGFQVPAGAGKQLFAQVLGGEDGDKSSPRPYLWRPVGDGNGGNAAGAAAIQQTPMMRG